MAVLVVEDVVELAEVMEHPTASDGVISGCRRAREAMAVVVVTGESLGRGVGRRRRGAVVVLGHSVGTNLAGAKKLLVVVHSGRTARNHPTPRTSPSVWDGQP